MPTALNSDIIPLIEAYPSAALWISQACQRTYSDSRRGYAVIA